MKKLIGLMIVLVLVGCSATTVEKNSKDLTSKSEELGIERPLNEEAVPAFLQKELEPIEIIFVGDVMMEWSLKNTINTKGVDYPFQNVKEDIQKADYAVANLETAITTSNNSFGKQYNFKANPIKLEGLVNAGFDLVSLANNHTMDYREEGLLDTIKYLREYGIDFVGAGKNSEEAYASHTVVLNDQKVTFLAFSRVLPDVSWYATDTKPGIASGYQEERVIDIIEKEKVDTDYVLVYMHWGIERANRPENYQRDYARKMIDAGADAVIGAHPHVLQGFEFYDGKPIAYSLGNFLFPDYITGPTAETGLLSIIIEEEQVKMKFNPFYIDNDVIVDKGEDYRNRIYQYLEGISYDVFIEDGEIKPKN
ncbi:CapA family protein [Alkalihalobacterium chitinilyticum]|uniref:CapA family protein n=1 Tax=Alkalihalobacterium chitinilyticum TaxID=2980103 RepID=A0ABT5VD25_9BACI|nr:CapA family protein [Alkalihalobacterium chitinilyticum]MDE5413328.1 CapA family protein [Alkalihalobacterium chitinilyticum]